MSAAEQVVLDKTIARRQHAFRREFLHVRADVRVSGEILKPIGVASQCKRQNAIATQLIFRLALKICPGWKPSVSHQIPPAAKESPHLQIVETRLTFDRERRDQPVRKRRPVAAADHGFVERAVIVVIPRAVREFVMDRFTLVRIEKIISEIVSVTQVNPRNRLFQRLARKLRIRSTIALLDLQRRRHSRRQIFSADRVAFHPAAKRFQRERMPETGRLLRRVARDQRLVTITGH